MKNFNFIGLSLITIFSLVGCGSDSSSSDTGTGYYVDSPVVGVDYTCGSKRGRTENEGRFVFEKGKGCTFSIAGVELRTTPSSKLIDGEKVFEDNKDVARFLQSLDNDGNPENGISIHNDVLNELANALADNGSSGRIPKGGTLDAVVASLDNDVPLFRGHVRTNSEVRDHIEETRSKYFPR